MIAGFAVLPVVYRTATFDQRHNLDDAFKMLSAKLMTYAPKATHNYTLYDRPIQQKTLLKQLTKESGKTRPKTAAPPKGINRSLARVV